MAPISSPIDDDVAELATLVDELVESAAAPNPGTTAHLVEFKTRAGSQS